MSKNIKIFLSAFIVFLVCMLWCNKVDGVSYTLTSLESSNNLYCINHSGHMSNYVTADYNVVASIDIVGNIATTTRNGKTYKSNSYVHGQLAYILTMGNYTDGYGTTKTRTARQLALWNVWNNWYGTCKGQNELGIEDLNLSDSANSNVSQTSDSKNLIAEATKYATENGGQEPSVELISKNKSTTVTSEGKFYGPFRVKYNDTIQSIQIYGNDNQGLINRYVDICTSTTASSAISKGRNNTFNGKNLPNNRDFYIYVKNDNISVNKFKINVQLNSCTKVSIDILKSSKVVRGGTAQNLIRVSKYEGSSDNTASIEIGFAEYTELNLRKLDANDKHALSGAKFILRHNNQCAIATENSKGYYEVTDWTSSQSSATKFEVGSNGITIRIKRDDKTLYALEEIEAPNGYAIGLGRAGNSDSVTDNTTYGDKYGLAGAKYYFDINSTSTKASINLLNSKKVTLTIEKVNKNNTSQKLENVEFYFKHNNKYAIVRGSGNYEVVDWTTDQKQATKIITNKEGKIVISFAEDPQQRTNQYIYGLEETTNESNIINLREPKFVSGSGTYKQNEDGYKLAFYLNYDYSSKRYTDSRNVSIVVGNEVPEERIVTLRKVSSGNYNYTVNATFVIAHNNCYANAVYENGAWEIKKWLPYNLGEYTLDDEEVTKITLVNGEAKIKLPIDDKLYGFIETATQDGFTMKMGYIASQSKNITPFDGTKKEWSKYRGIDANGILNNWQDEDTRKTISEFFFNINKNINANDEIKVCLSNDGGTTGLKKLVVRGRVWIDTPQGKDNEYNKLYDNNDESPKNSVKVTLMRKGGGEATYTPVWNNGYGAVEVGTTRTSSIWTSGEFELNCNIPITTDINDGFEINDVWYNTIRKNILIGYQSLSLEDYYLKFEYSRVRDGDTVTIYRPILYNSGDENDLARMKDYKNNSKAISTSERDVAEIRNLSKYTDTCFSTRIEQTRIYDAKYANSLYDSYHWNDSYISVGILEYMNLGLKERISTGGDIVENLEYVRIVMPSQTNPREKNTFIYEYGSLSGDDNREGINTDSITVMTGIPEVSYQNKTINKYYTRPFYPSDIYSTLANDSEMEVYVVYSITITNSEPMDGEICMEVLSLKNTYDTSRYTFSTNTSNVSNNMVKTMQSDFGNWDNDSENGILTRKTIGTTEDNLGHSWYRYSTNHDTYVKKLSKKESVTYYVQFKVTRSALEVILANPNGVAEANPTKATANIRHYCRDYDEHYCESEKCNGHSCRILEYGNQTTISDDAPYMVFQIDQNSYDRTIKGTVFYDKESGSDIVGNGIYDVGDGTVSGVIVELRKSDALYKYDTEVEDLFKGNESKLATIYYVPGNDSTKYKSEPTSRGVPAITKTDANGNYSFTGVTPGDYFLVFKYPDGHEQYLRATNDNTGNNSNSETTGININNVKKYEGMQITTPNYLKSTVVKNDDVQSAILSGDISEWYRKLEGKDSYSIAVDNLMLRTKLNQEQWNKLYGNGDEPSVKTMIAGSAPFRIKIESDDSNSRSPEQSDMNNYRECDYSMFSFGIIRQAEQKASLEKVISNVKLTHDPQVIFDGNPEILNGQNIGVTDLDNTSNGGSSYTRVEIQQDALYGSTLTLTYELRVRNESENNYYETDESKYGFWYMFGDKSSAKLVTLSTDVDDYLDKYLTYEGNSNNATASEIKNYDNEKAAIYRTLYTKDYTTDKFGLVGNVNNSDLLHCIDEKETLMYEIKYNKKIQKGGTETVNISARKLLSGREEEWNYQNSAEIKKLVNRTNDGDADKPDNQQETKSVSLVITPEKLNYPNVKIEDKTYPNTKIVITTPTGMDKQSKILYIITGVVSLIVLCGGIVIIKKKVL